MTTVAQLEVHMREQLEGFDEALVALTNTMQSHVAALDHRLAAQSEQIGQLTQAVAQIVERLPSPRDVEAEHREMWDLLLEIAYDRRESAAQAARAILRTIPRIHE